MAMNKGDRYSNMDDVTRLGFMVSAMTSGNSKDGDTGAVFPVSDAEDMSRGAQYVPGEVTVARRKGQKVNFISNCDYSASCWYWEMPDGNRIYYCDPADSKNIKAQGGKCPKCGNNRILGGVYDAKGNKIK
jgi:hypothetical protein